jgi:hypothetical protein
LHHKNFFKDLNIKTPHVLNKTNSLKRTANHTGLLKLTTCISRAGKKLRISNLVINSIYNIVCSLKGKFPVFKNSLSFKNYTYFISLFFMNSAITVPTRLSPIVDTPLYYNNIISSSSLIKTDEINPENLYKSSLKKFNFLFSFYIYKVDKSIYKNSRGRSGKLTFVWKYVAPYKRRTLVSHWLAKEVRVAPGKKLQDRINFVIQKFLLTPRETLAWRVNKFSTKYVYYYLRRSLGETCRTVMN